jgi:hypothetical protein
MNREMALAEWRRAVDSLNAAGRIIDNRFIIVNLIACERDTPRVIREYNVFDIQERIIEDIDHQIREECGSWERPWDRNR